MFDSNRQLIIFVDDSILIRAVGKQALADHYTFMAAASGEELFKILKRVLPDLILLDVEMPGMNGFDVIRKLKADSRTADIPVIFITGHSDADSELEGLGLGAIDYISKPFSVPLLLRRVQTHLLLHERHMQNIDRLEEIQERNIDLEELKEAAERASLAKSRFLSSMSHEIRTPLNVIVGLSELALDNNELNDDTYDALEKIYNAGAMLLSIVNDLIDISRIESGKFELAPNEYDIPSLINDTVALNTVKINEEPIELKLFVDETLPSRLLGDAIRMKQVFNNIIGNAIKYTDSGTIEWHISYEKRYDAVWLVSVVKDTGVGIKEEELAAIFEHNELAKSTTDPFASGLGLGLSMAKQLVDLMGGEISAQSEYGVGSTFTVKIPQEFVSETEIGKAVADNLMNYRYVDSKRRRNAKITRIQLPYARVLIVDDVSTNLEIAKGMLKPYGMKIDTVTRGQAAIDLIRKESPLYNAIFMDHMMPGMDGVEATQIIRSLPSPYAKHIPIIALTANAVAGNEEMFLSNGFSAFVAKPIDMLHMDAVIRKWVRDKDQETALETLEAPPEPPLEDPEPQRESAEPREEEPEEGAGLP